LIGSFGTGAKLHSRKTQLGTSVIWAFLIQINKGDNARGQVDRSRRCFSLPEQTSIPRTIAEASGPAMMEGTRRQETIAMPMAANHRKNG
jgi:hypothetical protein